MSDAANIETYETREAWLAARRTGIGSSDAPVILGLSPWKSAFELWAEKTGAAEPSAEETEWLEWGRRLEPVIAAKYAEETGRALMDLGPYVIVRDSARPWLIASPDRGIAPPSLSPERGPGVLEVKTAAFFKAEEWVDGPPLLYQVQLQHQLRAFGYAWGSIAVLLGGQRFRWQDQDRNDRFLALLLEQEEAFWDRVQRGTPPTPDGRPSTKEILSRMYPSPQPGVVIDLPPDALAWDRQRLEGRELIERGETLKAEAENLFRAAIGHALAGVLPDGTIYRNGLVTRKEHMVAASTFRQLRRQAPKRR